MRQYWHTDEVSRAIGNTADRDVWKVFKSPNAERHPRRQLIEAGRGDAVNEKFLQWTDYRSFKLRQGPDFTDPCHTVFLSTRCKCLTLPAMEQCACKIHSQQVLYIEALGNVDMASVPVPMVQRGRLGEVKVIHTRRWTGNEAGEPVSGEEVVDARKVKRTYRIRTRLASCFCSACQRSQ